VDLFWDETENFCSIELELHDESIPFIDESSEMMMTVETAANTCFFGQTIIDMRSSV
jgi:hypothetical protein